MDTPLPKNSTTQTIAELRDWLGERKFAPGDEGHGYRMLGLLERIEGNLPAAAAASAAWLSGIVTVRTPC
mgnify:CR=1 FL=1